MRNIELIMSLETVTLTCLVATAIGGVLCGSVVSTRSRAVLTFDYYMIRTHTVWPEILMDPIFKDFEVFCLTSKI